MRHFFFAAFIALFLCALSGCGFHLRGEWHFAPALQKIYLETNDPYGQLATELKQQLKASHIPLVPDKEKASIILRIAQDSIDQTLLGLNATQQTRQYKLTSTIQFSLQDTNGTTVLPAQIIQDSRVITVQSNQILGSSNEINLFTQQMRRSLAYMILSRLESQETTNMLADAMKHTKIKAP